MEKGKNERKVSFEKTGEHGEREGRAHPIEDRSPGQEGSPWDAHRHFKADVRFSRWDWREKVAVWGQEGGVALGQESLSVTV